MFRSENPEEDFRNILKKRLSVDDLVYHGSLVAFHKNQLDRRADDMPLNDTALYHLINIGVHDMDAIDKPWDAGLFRGSPLDYGDQRTEQGLCVLFL